MILDSIANIKSCKIHSMKIFFVCRQKSIIWVSKEGTVQINTHIKLYTHTHTHTHIYIELDWRTCFALLSDGALIAPAPPPAAGVSRMIMNIPALQAHTLSLSLSRSPFPPPPSPSSLASSLLSSLQQQLLIFALMWSAKIHHKVTHVFLSSFLNKCLKNSALLLIS